MKLKAKTMKRNIHFTTFGIMCFLFCTINTFSSNFDTKKNKKTHFLEEQSDNYVFNNKSSRLIIHKKSWQIEVLDTNDIVHYSEYKKPSFLVNENWITPQDSASVKTVTDDYALFLIPSANGTNIEFLVEKAGDFGFKLKYNLPNVEISYVKGIVKLNLVEEIYGFGEMWNEHVAQRGQSFELWDKIGTPDQCAYMPYYVSTNNYAFYLNYGGLVKFDIGQSKSDELVFEMPAPELEYTVVIGEDIASSVKNYLKLTGMPAKPPRWSFKPWYWLMANPFAPGDSCGIPPYSNYTLPADGLKSLKGEHVLKMVNKLQEMNMPVGVTWLEPVWQNASTTMIPNPTFSPDLKKLIGDLKNLGVNTLAWTVPYTTSEASNWEVALKNDYLVKKPDSSFEEGKVKVSEMGELVGKYYNYIDFFNPKAYNWWQDQINQSLELGLKGFKLDAGQDLPDDAILFGGRLGKDVHNSYALEYNRVFYETLKQKYGDDFLTIPRAAWIGSSANTNSKWPGDLKTSFGNNGLPSSVFSTLSLAFSGLPFVSTDIGGYTPRPAPEDVWIRWAQFGAMLPGMQTLNMPWWYSEKAQDYYRYLSWLHTDLIPFWNTLANEAHVTGAPLVRPLVWNFQNDIKTWQIDDQFILGTSLLVAPVIDTREWREIYLPEGRWINFWNENEIITGPKTITWSSKVEGLWKFPLFIKEGAIIPMEISNNVSGFGWSESKEYLTIAIWPKVRGKSQFVLNDVGEKVRFEIDQTENDILLEWDKSDNDYLFRINSTSETAPSKIEIGDVENNEILQKFKNLGRFKANQKSCWFFDNETKKLWIKIKQDNSKRLIRIIKT